MKTTELYMESSYIRDIEVALFEFNLALNSVKCKQKIDEYKLFAESSGFRYMKSNVDLVDVTLVESQFDKDFCIAHLKESKTILDVSRQRASVYADMRNIENPEIISWIKEDYLPALNIRENQILSEVNQAMVDDITNINEAVKDNVVTIITNLWEKIKKLFSSFWAFVTGKNTKSDAKFLTDNKDAILNNTLKYPYTVCNYWKQIPLLDKIMPPKFNYNEMKDTLKDQKAFITKYYPAFKIGTDDDYKSAVTNIIRGEKREWQPTEIPVRQLYDFCANYETTCSKCKQAFDELNKFVDSFINDVKNGKSFGENTVYLAIKNCEVLAESLVFLEVDGGGNSAASGSSSNGNSAASNNNGGASRGTSTNTQQNTNTNNNNNNQNNNQQDNQPSGGASRGTSNDANQQQENPQSDAVNLANTYLSIAANMNGIMMNMYKEIYDSYMFILRDQVKASKENGTKKPAANNNNANNNTQNNNANKK